MPKIIKKKVKKSTGKASTRSSSKVSDMTGREYRMRKAEIASRNKKMKYDYKTASKNTRAAVQKSTVRSAAGSSAVVSGSNAASEQARSEREMPVYNYRNPDAAAQNSQQDGGIGSGGSSFGYKGSDDDF